MEEDYLLISGIQHFCFCRRQWALIHIENRWDENQLTAEGRAMHVRVHESGLITKRGGIITLRGLPVRSNRLMITGVCDAVELIPDEEGIPLRGRKGKWRIHPVEYKHGKEKKHDSDRLQLAAQCVCLEEMLVCRIERASLYYGETHNREDVIMDHLLREKLESIILEMHGYYQRKYTPKVRKMRSCRNCSLADICLPEIMSGVSVEDYVHSHINEDDI